MTKPPHNHNLENWPEGADISVLIVDGQDCQKGASLFDSNCSRLRDLLDKACQELSEKARIFLQNRLSDGYEIPVNCFGQLHVARQKNPPVIPDLRQRGILVNDVFYFLDRAYLPWESREGNLAVAYNPPCPHVLRWRNLKLGNPSFGIVTGTIDAHYQVRNAVATTTTIPCFDLVFQSLLSAGEPESCSTIDQTGLWKVLDGKDLFCLNYADDMSRTFKLLEYDPDTKKIISPGCSPKEPDFARVFPRERPDCLKFGYGISPFYMDLFVPIVHGSAEECILGPNQSRVFDARFMTGRCLTSVSISSYLSRSRGLGGEQGMPCSCQGKISDLTVSETDYYEASVSTESCRIRDSLDGHALNLDELPIPPFVNPTDFKVDLNQVVTRQVSQDMLPLYLMNVKECYEGNLAGYIERKEKVTSTECHYFGEYGDILEYSTKEETKQYPHSEGAYFLVRMGIDPTYFATMEEEGNFPRIGVFLRTDDVVNPLPKINKSSPIYDVKNGTSSWSVSLSDSFFTVGNFGMVIPLECCNTGYAGWTSGNKVYTGTVTVKTEASTRSSAVTDRDYCTPYKSVTLETGYTVEVLISISVHYSEGAGYVNYAYGNITLANQLKGLAAQLLGDADSVDRDCITSGIGERYFRINVGSTASISSITKMNHQMVYDSWLAAYNNFGCGKCSCGDLIPSGLSIGSYSGDSKFVAGCTKDLADMCGLNRDVVGDDFYTGVSLCYTGILANSVREAASSLPGEPPCPISWCFSMKDAYLPTIGWNEKSDGCPIVQPAFYCDYVSEYGNIYDCEPNMGRVKERCKNEQPSGTEPGGQPETEPPVLF